MTRTFSKSVRLQAWQRSQGKCECCSAKLYPSAFEYDHVLPHGLGGKSTLENCEVLCRACHSVKTHGNDRPQICKADRQRAAHLGIKTKKGRPMAGTKASGWRRRMNGTVERRNHE